jgi:hypothetical protein
MDADTALFFLSANTVRFMKPTDDQWYSVHIEKNSSQVDWSKQNYTYFLADNEVNVLGCALQVQFCNPALAPEKACGPLTSTAYIPDYVSALWPNEAEQEFIVDFMEFTGESVLDIADLVIQLGGWSLQSRQGLSAGVQKPIPDDQWQLDVSYWQGIILAGLQRTFVDLATGPKFLGIEKYLDPPLQSEGKSLCNSQVKAKYSYNFNSN